jgi:hypothetical protein
LIVEALLPCPKTLDKRGIPQTHSSAGLIARKSAPPNGRMRGLAGIRGKISAKSVNGSKR